MKSISISISIIILCLCIILVSCSERTSADESKPLVFEGVLLKENSILITKSKETVLPKGQLISLSFPEDLEKPPVGSLYKYEIKPILRESWPPQGDALRVEEIKELAGTIDVSFKTAEDISTHLPSSAHLIDVRTAEEYVGGHVAGAVNISVDVIKEKILDAVPEKSDIVIVYCRSGNRSVAAGRVLEDLGYMVILNAGGIKDYSGEIVQGDM